MKPTLLLIGYRAYGDFLYAVPVFGELFEQFEVHLETNTKGWELFHDDPRFASVTVFEVFKYPPADRLQIVQERWIKLVEELQPDRIINLWRSLETECIVEAYQPEFLLPVEERREIFGGKNFHDAVVKKCGTREPDGLDGLWFTEEQEAWAKRWRQREEGNFILLAAPAGSCAQKIYPDLPSLLYGLVEKYPRMKVLLVGDDRTKDIQFDHPRIINISSKPCFKQAVLMAREADFVFGGETGMLVAAGMFGTPKTMLCTSSSVYQACGRHQNDFSVQSSSACSPCHRAVYSNLDCEGVVETEGGEWYPVCTTGFDFNHIFNTIGAQYELCNLS